MTHILSLGSMLIPNAIFNIHGILNCIIFNITFIGLINNNELIMIKSSGISYKEIFKPFIYYLLIFFFILFFVAFYISPSINKNINTAISKIKDQYILSVIKTDIVNEFKNVNIYYQDIKNNKMHNFVIIKKDNKQDEIMTIFAKEAVIEEYEDGAYLFLKDSKTVNIKYSSDSNIEPMLTKSEVSKIKINSLIEKESSVNNAKSLKSYKINTLFKDYKQDIKIAKELHRRLVVLFYSFFAGLCTLSVLSKAKTNRANLNKYISISTISSGFCILFSNVVVNTIIKNYNIINIFILYSIPIAVLIFAHKLSNKI